MRGPRVFVPTDVYPTVRVRSRGYLPHWDLDGGLYSLTFRLIDSLPRHIEEQIRQEHSAWVRGVTAGQRELTAIENAQAREFLFRRLDDSLDAGNGSCWMNRPDIARIVNDAILFGHQLWYDLHAWSVMPNHAHLVARLRVPLEDVCHSLKSFTATACNKALARRGAFWQREYFDRLVRDERDLQNTISYVANNPSKAGLEPWPWCGIQQPG